MNKPFRSLINLCAFGLLLTALYLNFVDLDKAEDAVPVNRFINADKKTPSVAAIKTAHLVATGH